MRAFIVATVVAASAAASAESALDLNTVLESVLATHPRLESARNAIDEVRGERLAASARFEPVLRAEGTALPSGYYDYWRARAELEQIVPGQSIRLRAGYRLGRGTWPSYYGEYETRDGGELYASVNVPLLADRSIDEARYKILHAELDLDVTSAELRQTWIDVAAAASKAYWKWVAAGLKLRIAMELEEIARTRVSWIDAQVSSGALPRISATDAQRVLLARESAVLKANGQLTEAQQALALYVRDTSGVPQTMPLVAVPATISEPPRVDGAQVERWTREAIEGRPDLAAIESQRAQARVGLDLAENRQLPRLDAQAFVARDLGDGRESLGETDFGVGLSLSVPTLMRRGRGEAQAARAKLGRIDAYSRGLRDRIATELRRTVRLAEVASQRHEIALERLAATRQLAEAERQRLRSGASDLLTVNLREIDVANAAYDVIDAALERQENWIDLLYLRGTTAAGDRIAAVNEK